MTKAIINPGEQLFLGRDFNITYRAAGSETSARNLSCAINYVEGSGLKVDFEAAGVKGRNLIRMKPMSSVTQNMPQAHVFTYTFKEGADYTSKVAGIGIALVAENNSYSRSYPYDGDITHQGGSRQKMMDVGVKRILSC